MGMKEMQAHLELLRAQIAECERIQATARSQTKRDVFARVLARYRAIAAELERAIARMSPASDILAHRRTQEAFPKEMDD